jgi:2-polyprenyl-6-methoxyphenol hydroxylase-like FAD-dependent oxidoreductase
LPQTLYEPIALRYATQHGFPCRFSTELLSFDDDPAAEYVAATVRDKITNTVYLFHCKYLFGADGAKSRIVQQLNLPLVKAPGQGTALNILIKADMSHLMENRMGNLHYILQPDKEISDVGWIGIVRMVKPWNEWLIILFYAPHADTTVIPPNDVLIKKAQDLIGDDSIDIELLRVDKWTINEVYAEKYREGRV